MGWAAPEKEEEDNKDSEKKVQNKAKQKKKKLRDNNANVPPPTTTRDLVADVDASAAANSNSTAAGDATRSRTLPLKKKRIDESVVNGDNFMHEPESDVVSPNSEEMRESVSPAEASGDKGDNTDANSESDGSTIVTFTPPGSEIVVTGSAIVTVLVGRVEIMGCTIDSTGEYPHVQICSPDGSWSSALTILDVSATTGNTESQEVSSAALNTSACTRIQISSLSWDGSDATTTRTFHVAQRSEVRSATTFANRWKVAADAVLSDLNQMRLSNISALAEHAPDPARVLVCGAKNVGKSTYVRYLVNKMMTSNTNRSRKRKRVAVLDCDVGQPELGPPGLITLTILEHPLLSPPHAHMICNGRENNSECRGGNNASFEAASGHASVRFFGHVSAKADPSSYTAAIASLVSQYEILAEGGDTLPLVVNTSGWVKGMGFEILSSIVDVVRPGHIIQIVGAARTKFFDLTPHAFEGRSIHVVEAFGRLSRLPTEQDLTPPPSRSVSPVPPASDGVLRAIGSSESASPPISTTNEVDAPVVAITSTLRSLRLASYFLGGYSHLLALGTKFWPAAGGIYDPHCNVASTLAAMRPYLVPFRSVCCSPPSLAEYRGTAQTDELILKSLNGAIVGLCYWSGEDAKKEESVAQHGSCSLRIAPSNLNTALLPCLGLGIIRGIDRVRECFYILTPLAPEELTSRKPNVIVRARIQLPLECTFRGVHSEAFQYQSCDGLTSGIGDDVMKSRNAAVKK